MSLMGSTLPLHPFLQVTAGSYCTYAVKFDGTVSSVGEGSYGRLGHSHSDNARLLNSVESLQGEVFMVKRV